MCVSYVVHWQLSTEITGGVDEDADVGEERWAYR